MNNPDIMTVEEIARDLATEPHPGAPNVVRLGKAHLAPIETFWVVRNPKPKDSLEDSLEDILYEATPSTIADYAIGVGSERWQQGQPSFYRYREDAFKDAVSRLRSALKEAAIKK